MYVEVILWKPDDPIPLALDPLTRGANLHAVSRGYSIPTKTLALALHGGELGLAEDAPWMAVHRATVTYLRNAIRLGNDGGWIIKQLTFSRTAADGERFMAGFDASRVRRLTPLQLDESMRPLCD